VRTWKLGEARNLQLLRPLAPRASRKEGALSACSRAELNAHTTPPLQTRPRTGGQALGLGHATVGNNSIKVFIRGFTTEPLKPRPLPGLSFGEMNSVSSLPYQPNRCIVVSKWSVVHVARWGQPGTFQTELGSQASYPWRARCGGGVCAAALAAFPASLLWEQGTLSVSRRRLHAAVGERGGSRSHQHRSRSARRNLSSSLAAWVAASALRTPSESGGTSQSGGACESQRFTRHASKVRTAHTCALALIGVLVCLISTAQAASVAWWLYTLHTVLRRLRV
jgi:hypothetical protein